MTKPFSTVFGTGTPVRKRNVWKGPERLYSAIVGARKDPVQLRPNMSNVTAGFGLIAHNGLDTYVVASGASMFTTPDLLTGTARALATTPAGIGSGLVYYKGSFFYCAHTSTPVQVVSRSADKGVTWSNYANPGTLSVVGDLLYMVSYQVNNPAVPLATFYTTSDPAAPAVARAFSRSSFWGKVVGNANRQYCFSRTASATPLGEVSTNGTSFAQDVGFETLAARSPVGSALINAVTLAAGRVMVFSCTTSGLYCLVADAAGTWSIGASLPQELDGYRFVSVGPGGTYSVSPNAYTDADGITSILFIVQDPAGNYLARIGTTYDGKDWQFLPPHYNFGTTAPTVPLGVFSKIDGTPLFNASGNLLAEANMNAVELFYEL